MIFELLCLSAVFMIALITASPAARIWICAVCIIASGASTWVSPTGGIAARAAALAFALSLSAYSVSDRSQQNQLNDFSGPITKHFTIAVTALLVIIGVVHADWSNVLNTTLGLLLLLCIRDFPRHVPRATLQRIVQWTIDGYVILSLLLYFIDPSQALVQGRLRGIGGNANILGFFCLLGVGIALLSPQRPASRLFRLSFLIWALYLTNSRTSIAAVAVLVLIGLVIGITSAKRFGQMAVPVVIIVWLARPNLVLGLWNDITGRSFDTRTSTVQLALDAAHQELAVGVGFGGLGGEIASSPLRALAAGGVVGLSILFCLYAILISDAARLGAPYLALCIAAIVHSFGEGWLLSTTGPMILFFCLTLLCFRSPERDAPTCD